MERAVHWQVGRAVRVPGEQSARRPLALVEHEDRPGFFTLFFTAFRNNHEDPRDPIGGYENLYASEMELVLTM